MKIIVKNVEWGIGWPKEIYEPEKQKVRGGRRLTALRLTERIWLRYAPPKFPFGKIQIRSEPLSEKMSSKLTTLLRHHIVRRQEK